MALNVLGLVAVIIFYFLILIMGFVAMRIKSKRKEKMDASMKVAGEQVMLAGRSIGLYVGCFTMTATWLGGGYINGAAESVYSKGLIWCQAPLGYSLSLLIGGLFFAKIMRIRGYVTMLDPLQEKYGSVMGGLLYIPALIGETCWSASVLAALGATLSVILDIDMMLSVILSACVAVLYTFFGGLYSVAFTDIIQLICIFIGLWMTIPFAITNKHVQSITTTRDQWLGDAKYALSQMKWWDYAFYLTFGGIPWQAYFQRVLSSKTPRNAQVLSYVACAGCIFMTIPAVLVGAIAASTNWNEVNLPSHFVKNNTVADKRLVLPLVLQFLTPTWVSFFGLGAVSAAVMSSVDSSMLSASTMFAQNIYRVFRPRVSNRELTWVVRIAILGIGAISTGMALSIKSIYALFALCSDLVFCILLPQLACAVYISFVNSYGSIVAYALAFILRLGGGEKMIQLKPFIYFPGNDYETEEYWFPLRIFTMIMATISLLLVSWITNYLFFNGYLAEKYDFCGIVEREKLRISKTHVENKVELVHAREINEDGRAHNELPSLHAME